MYRVDSQALSLLVHRPLDGSEEVGCSLYFVNRGPVKAAHLTVTVWLHSPISSADSGNGEPVLANTWNTDHGGRSRFGQP